MCALHRHMCGCLCLAEFVSLEPRVCVCVRLAQAHVWGLLPCTGTCPFVVPSATFLLLCAFHRDICWACVLHRLSALSQGCVCALHRHMCAAAEAVSLATSVCVCVPCTRMCELAQFFEEAPVFVRLAQAHMVFRSFRNLSLALCLPQAHMLDTSCKH